MKKFVPLVLLVIGVGVLAFAFFLSKGKKESTSTKPEDESVVKEVPFEKRPVVSLTPSADGHWLTLKIEQIKINAASLDYDLIYDLSDDRQQGVPGTIKLEGKNEVSEDLLLGSESSGKFRYDEGVEKGTLTFKFRDSGGKLVAKMSTDFNLTEKPKELKSLDGKLTFTLDSQPKQGFFVVINTLGVTDAKITSVKSGPYGVFTSITTDIIGTYTLGSLNEKTAIKNGRLIVFEQ
jgi:hypothetical protein